MDTASGVYLHIKDSSFQTSGSSSLTAIIPMTTLKGELGMNDVTANTFKDILGYDLTYNSNYEGLSQILEQVTHAYVWRLNQNAKLGNAYFTSSTSDKAYNEDAEVFEDVTRIDPEPILAVANNCVGNWGTTAVRFAPTDIVTSIVNDNPTEAIPQEIVLDDINGNELKTLYEKEVLGSCIFYNASDNSVVGVIMKDIEDNWKVYKVVDGEIVYDVVETVTTETNIWTDGTNFYKGNLEDAEEPEGEAGTPVELGAIRFALSADSYYQKNDSDEWHKVLRLTPTAIEVDETAESDASIISELESASDITISYVLYTYTHTDIVRNYQIGTATFDEEKLTIVLNKRMSADTFWSVHTIPSHITDWTCFVADYDGRQYVVKSEVNFSFNTESEIYIDNVDFGDVQVFAPEEFASDWETIREYFTLEGGTNGEKLISSVDIDTSVIDDVNANVLFMNGITDYRIVNRLATKCHSRKIHLFADAPAYSSYIDLYDWSKKIYQSEYVAIGARPDQEVDNKDKTIYVYPSVNYARILANMLNTYGNLCYPPAGASYGSIVAKDLIKCDYATFADEMKTNRINWQLTDSSGSMMWEQRTTYGLNTDLSYIAPVFIVDDLSDRLIAFERMFNFRYITRTDLLNQDSGIKSILEDFVTRGFITRYELYVPSYEEAQAAGRTLTIQIKVAIAKDSEVINIELELINS